MRKLLETGLLLRAASSGSGPHEDQIRVAEVLRPVRVGAAFRLNHEVDGTGAAEAHRANVIRLHHVEHLDHKRPTRRRRRHGNDFMPPIGATYRFAPHAFVRGQVCMRDESPPTLHFCYQEVSRFIETYKIK